MTTAPREAGRKKGRRREERVFASAKNNLHHRGFHLDFLDSTAHPTLASGHATVYSTVPIHESMS